MPEKSNARKGSGRMPRWRRRRRTLLSAVVVLAVVASLAFLGYWWAVSRAMAEAEERIAALLKSGGLLSSSARDEGAGMAPYVAAESQREEAPEALEEYTECLCTPALPAWEELAEALREAMRAYLASNEALLVELHKTARERAAVQPFTGPPSMGYADLEPLSRAIRLLQIEALVALEDGDAERATEAIVAAFAVAESVLASPYVWAEHLRMGYHKSVLTSFADALGSGLLGEAELARLEETLIGQTCDLEAALKKQLRWGLMVYGQPRLLMEAAGGHPLERWVPGLSGLMLDTSSVIGWNALDRPLFLRHMEEAIRIARTPDPERLYAYDQFLDPIKRGALRGFRLSHILPRVFIDRPVQIANHDARILAAGAAIAVERYRVTRGGPPPSLGTLVPSCLDYVPADPFNGMPMRYATDHEGYTIYSVGPDLADNGGTSLERSWDEYESGDAVFRVDYRCVEETPAP